MSCPICSYEMQKLSVSTNAGVRFDLDHCGHCAGTWFDPYEVNRIPYHEVSRLAGLMVKTKNTGIIPSIPYCPRCKTRILEAFQSDSIPRNIHFLHCPNCRGLFAGPKSLLAFKKNEEQYQNIPKSHFELYPTMAIAFAPLLFTVFLFVSTFITIQKLGVTKDERTRASENITKADIFRMNDGAYMLTFSTLKPAITRVYLGTSELNMEVRPVSLTPQTVHNIILKNLRENTTYLYKIRITDELKTTYTSKTKSFSTTP